MVNRWRYGGRIGDLDWNVNEFMISISPKRGNETSKRILICFKNERKLCVDNISLCDEIMSRKISENKLH